MEAWPEERLIEEHSGFFARALAVAVSSASSLNKTTMILPRLEGQMGTMGPLDTVPGAIKVDPTFKLVFVSVVGLTVLFGVVSVLLALFAQSNDVIYSLISEFRTLMGTGFGAVAGLLGGKAIGTTSRRRK